jgi:hypothetical protein
MAKLALRLQTYHPGLFRLHANSELWKIGRGFPLRFDQGGNYFTKGGNMETETKKEIYVEPKVIASYTKEELEETIKPHGLANQYGNNSGPV